MNRLFALPVVSFLLLLACTAPARAQEAKPDPVPEAEQDDPGIPADFNEYLKKLYPGLEPGGAHDLFNLQDPKNKDERHTYTVYMTQLLLEYMGALDMGSTISKLFDQYSRGKEGNTVTFKTLYAVVLMYYPPGRPNVTDAEKMLREAAEKAADYAYPWFLLANFEYARFMQTENSSPRPVLQALDKALEIKPDFLRAILLKGRLYMQAQPPRAQDVREMLAPLVKDRLPATPDDFEDLLVLYASAHGVDDLHTLINNLLQGGKLTRNQQIRALKVKATLFTGRNQYDDAIGVLNEQLKLLEPAKDPSAALGAHKRLAMCWTNKAMDLRASDKTLKQPGNKEKFDELINAAAGEHETCTEIERLHMPLALRGGEARQYVDFLTRGVGDLERARNWLKNYLDTTDLAKAQRTILDNQLRLIMVRLNPTEDGLIDYYESRVAADEMDELAVSLALAKENVRVDGKHFKQQRSLNFFLSQLENRQRLTVAYAAWLAADTALQVGGDAIAQAADAIAARLEKETELNSEAQADLQADLSEALKLIGHRPSQERAIRLCARLIDEAKTNRAISSLMKKIVNIWYDEAFLKGMKNPPAKPDSRHMTRPDRVVKWLNELADAVKAE